MPSIGTIKKWLRHSRTTGADIGLAVTIAGPFEATVNHAGVYILVLEKGVK